MEQESFERRQTRKKYKRRETINERRDSRQETRSERRKTRDPRRETREKKREEKRREQKPANTTGTSEKVTKNR